VGGGISTISQARDCMRHGAEKVVLGTTAYENPKLIFQIASEFGSQAVTVAIDVVDETSLSIRTHSGAKNVEMNACDFALLAIENGAGELLVQSIERDGTLDGFSTSALEAISKLVNVPIIASGGIKSARDVVTAIESGANAVAIGALFQFTEETPASVASELLSMGISVRSR
jgi:cyclase